MSVAFADQLQELDELLHELDGVDRFLAAGSRSWTDWVIIRDALRLVHRYAPNATLVQGRAYGADCITDVIWRHAGGTVEPHPAMWSRHGEKAGHIRNRVMVDSGIDLGLFFILNNSPGASNCYTYATTCNVPSVRFTLPTPR